MPFSPTPTRVSRGVTLIRISSLPPTPVSLSLYSGWAMKLSMRRRTGRGSGFASGSPLADATTALWVDSASMKLLLVEDSERLRGTLQHGLRGAGFTVDAAADGIEAKGFLAGYDYDLVVLDLMLPRLDGLGALRTLPAGGRRPRVLVLSARDQVGDRVGALNAGADDYLVKPFAFDELLARLHALARRPLQAQPVVLTLGPLAWDPLAQRASVDGQPLPLTPREFAVLGLLLRHWVRAVTR